MTVAISALDRARPPIRSPRKRSTALPRVTLESACLTLSVARPLAPAFVSLVFDLGALSWQALGQVRELVLLQDDDLVSRVGLLEVTHVVLGRGRVRVTGHGPTRSGELAHLRRESSGTSPLCAQAWVCPTVPLQIPGHGIALGTAAIEARVALCERPPGGRRAAI